MREDFLVINVLAANTDNAVFGLEALDFAFRGVKIGSAAQLIRVSIASEVRSSRLDCACTFGIEIGLDNLVGDQCRLFRIAGVDANDDHEGPGYHGRHESASRGDCSSAICSAFDRRVLAGEHFLDERNAATHATRLT
jgi:hypothetical protein